MKKTATTIRCVPRLGVAGTDVRAVDLDLPEDPEDQNVRDGLEQWFAQRGIADAVYDITVDDNGFFAVVNDEAFAQDWGRPLF